MLTASRPDSGICVPVQCRVSWLRRLSGAKRVQAYHQFVDVQRDRGTNGLRAVLIEQDDAEMLGSNLAPPAYVGLSDGGAERQVFEAEMVVGNPRHRDGNDNGVAQRQLEAV